MNNKLKYCFNCGGKLQTQYIDGQNRQICPKCKTVNYDNPVPSVAAVITDDKGCILLTKRSVEPGKGMWCLPGGFIEMGETPLDTLIRETKEETGLKIQPGKIIDAQAKIGGYHGDVIIIGYQAKIVGGELAPGDDAEEAKFFHIDEMPQIAFKSHKIFLEIALGIKLTKQCEVKFKG